MISPDNPYTQMQRREYEVEAGKWTPRHRDYVVGAWDEHNEWPDYELLFNGIDTRDMDALDFGCGPGRMMSKYWYRFNEIQGADINPTNLNNACDWFYTNGLPTPILYHTNGIDLQPIPNARYDLVYSAITLQHIPVYEIRYNLLCEFYRVLNTGGWFTAQMGYGETSDIRGRHYYDNIYTAEITNGGCDVNVTSPNQLEGDLSKLGFEDFSFQVREVGPNDWHPGWIWFRARKI